MILGKMVIQLSKEPSQRLLKHVVSEKFNKAKTIFRILINKIFSQVRCYLRLSDNTRACEALCQCLPDQLKDDTFATCLKVSHGNINIIINVAAKI